MTAPTYPAASVATKLLHADDVDHIAQPNHPIAPSLSTSTTFRAAHPDSEEAKRLRLFDIGEGDYDMQNPTSHVYSRYSQDTNLRAEKVLSGLMNGHALTYSSGLNAAFAAFSHYAPSVVALRKGYHGVHVSLDLYARGRDLKIIDLDDEYPHFPAEKKRNGGLLVWVETPLNPTGEARDLLKYAERAHAAGGSLTVDSTFAPPPLQDPFQQKADLVMHSGTKYFGGHSDLLCGVLAVQDKKEWDSLWNDRTFLGSNLGSLEAYLLLRSLRTLGVRVERQSKTATALATWLHGLSKGGEGKNDPKEISAGKVIDRTWHASLQPRKDKDTDEWAKSEGEDFNPREQMPGGWSPTFSFRTSKPEYARTLPHLTKYFTPATSLGGVESLLEHRIVSDAGEDPRLIRVSVGLEDLQDLQADLTQAMLQVLQLEKGKLNV